MGREQKKRKIYKLSNSNATAATLARDARAVQRFASRAPALPTRPTVGVALFGPSVPGVVEFIK